MPLVLLASVLLAPSPIALAGQGNTTHFPWAQQDVLERLTPTTDGRFGSCVAISGRWSLVGAPLDDTSHLESGAAYVFQRSGTRWSQAARLNVEDVGPSAWLGGELDLDGDLAIVTATATPNPTGGGRAFAFRFDGQSWVRDAELHRPSHAQGLGFGAATALQGETALVSDLRNGSTVGGSVHVYHRLAGDWQVTATMYPADGAPHDAFGLGVSLDGDRALVGAALAHSPAPDAGAAYVFTRTGTTWSQEAKLVASDAEAFDWFGNDVDLHGDLAVVGAHYADEFGYNSGAAYVFRRTGSTWVEEDKLVPSTGSRNDYFGLSVAIGDGFVLVAAPQADSPAGSTGAVYVFEPSGAGWREVGKIFSDPALGQNAFFGASTAADGRTFVVGSTGYAGPPLPLGSAHVFTDVQGTVYCTAGTTSGGCRAFLSATGTPSASAASGYTIRMTGAESGRPGLLFYGISGPAAQAWGSGGMASSSWLCVAGPLQRTPVAVTTGSAGSCDGTLALDWNQFRANTPGAIGSPFAAGTRVHAQALFRDPTSPNTTHLSDALEFTVLP